jgi:hypothetical protein
MIWLKNCSLSIKQQRLTTIYKIESDQHLKFIIIPLKSDFEWVFLIIDSLWYFLHMFCNYFDQWFSRWKGSKRAKNDQHPNDNFCLAHLTQKIMWGIAITWCLSSVNIYILIFFSNTTRPIRTKLCRNAHWMVL